jgi:hypothetical protein
MAAKDTTASQGPPLRFSQKLQPRKLLFALAIGVVLFYAIGIFVRCSQGIRVILHNESGVILEDATIKFENGKQYSLGEIAPGKIRKLFVISGSKSNIRLDFADPNGHIHSEIVAGRREWILRRCEGANTAGPKNPISRQKFRNEPAKLVRFSELNYLVP